MTIYLLVVGWLLCYGSPDHNCQAYHPPKEGSTIAAQAKVDFYLSKENAAKAYGDADKNSPGAVRLFSIWFATWCRRDDKDCVSIKELNVLPAQSYELSDKQKVEVSP